MSSARNKRLVVSALMLALALVLPYFTGGIPAIGNLLNKRCKKTGDVRLT